MNYLESSYQHEDMLTEGSKEAREPNIFKTDILCVVAGFAGDGKSSEVVMKKKEEK
jgi:hypothetical protein